MMEYVDDEHITIWDPLEKIIGGVEEITQICKEAKYHVRLQLMEKQQDGWSCGFHMLQWVEELMTSNGIWKKLGPD